MSKKGLLVLYSPQHLIQFIWYYCTYCKDKKWDALCLPNCFGAGNNKELCEKTGIFENVYYNDKYFLEASLKERFVQFSKMLGSFCIGKKQKYIKKFLSEYVDLNEYDEINVLSDFAIISGAFVELSKEKKVVIMEDGNADYNERTFKNIYKKPLNVLNTEGFILALLGYANVAYLYPLRATRYCDKFSSRPDSMKYVDFRSINQLYDFSSTNMALYERIVERTYGNVFKSDALQNTDVILFTTPISDYTNNPEKYVALVGDYIAKNYNSVVVKKHPRDTGEYGFAETVCFYIPQTIPSEVLFPYLVGKKLIFLEPSSMLLNVPKNSDVECLFLKNLREESVLDNTYEKYPDIEDFYALMRFFELDNYVIKEL